jgi:acetoin utilization deacetylase AcuC-like enzyme
VAVVDFDVHHGNGTEDILAGDERALMVSIFQHPFYPYSGDRRSGAQHGQRAGGGVHRAWTSAKLSR